MLAEAVVEEAARMLPLVLAVMEAVQTVDLVDKMVQAHLLTREAAVVERVICQAEQELAAPAAPAS
jgi:hypothetical protein